MILLGLYGLIIVAAIVWVAVDKYATDVFGFFNKELHESARGIGVYWEWAGSNLGRFVFLSTLALGSLAITILVFRNNPLELEAVGLAMLLVAMIAGSALLIALPHMADRLRLTNLIYWATSAVTTEFSLSSWQASIQETWDVAEYETSQDWRAWHPRAEDYERDPIWRHLVPVIYLKQGGQPSLVVPYMWEYFIAWNWPGAVHAEEPLPFTGPGDTKFFLKSLRQLPGRHGWTVIRAEMEDFDGVPVAA